MRFTTLFAILSLVVALAGAMPAPKTSNSGDSGTKSTSSSKSGKKAKPPKPQIGVNHCKKRDGECKNLFIVYYKPLGSGMLRHWALFVTDASKAKDGTGTIYQVTHNSQHPSGLELDPRPGKKAIDAGSYDDAKLLGNLDGTTVDKYFHSYGQYLLDDIGDHNKEKSNMTNLKNCQHWTKDLVDMMVGDGVLPSSARTTMGTIPEK